jgi:hypothetical protein
MQRRFVTEVPGMSVPYGGTSRPRLAATAIFGAARGDDGWVVTIDRQAIRQQGAFILSAIQNL